VKTFIVRGVAIFSARRPLHDSFAWKTKIYQHYENINNMMGRRGKFSITLFLPFLSLLLSVLQKWAIGFVDSKERSLFTNYI